MREDNPRTPVLHSKVGHPRGQPLIGALTFGNLSVQRPYHIIVMVLSEEDGKHERSKKGHAVPGITETAAARSVSRAGGRNVSAYGAALQPRNHGDFFGLVRLQRYETGGQQSLT